MVSVTVAGAGQCGLTVAADLARLPDFEVTLIERLPAAGGQLPEGRDTEACIKRAMEAAVLFKLGALAVRWDGQAVQALGHQGAMSIASHALVVATGTRPATLTELGIAGERTAGVLPGSAALHLLESGVLLGRRPTILGGGELAARCLEVLRHGNVDHVTVVAANGCADRRLTSADICLEGWRITRLSGTPRVNTVEVDRGRAHARITSDAVLLCEGRVAMRNIEGAVFGGRNVVYCQSLTDPKSIIDVQAVAAHARFELLDIASKQRKER